MHKVHFLTDPALFQAKETLYLQIRQEEGRLLSDEAVRQLPEVPRNSPYNREWRWRRRSFNRFHAYLKQKKQPVLRVLDLGCGNGWMARHLAENPEWEVWALDVNRAELEQGARLFSNANLQFYYADIASEELPKQYFDQIVLAASVQYFPDVKALLVRLRTLLRAGGEIHVLDSPFYHSGAQQAAAKARSLAYYSQKGAAEMASYYHHHHWEEARHLGAKDLNKPLIIKILRKIKWLAPFPWLRWKV